MTPGYPRGMALRNRRKTHCPQGHPYSAENTYVGHGGKRACRRCQTVRAKEYQSAYAERHLPRQDWPEWLYVTKPFEKQPAKSEAA